MLPIGSVLAVISQFIMLLPFIYKKGYRHRWLLDIKDKYIKDMAYMVLPVIVGVSVDKMNLLIDRTLASRIAVGGISSLNYAGKLNEFVLGIFVSAIATVIYPMISRLAAKNNIIELKKTLVDAISGINLLVVPSAVGTMLFSQPIIKMLFGRGAFDEQAIAMTSYALLFYSIGMVSFGFREIILRAFYSLHDTKTPMINGAIAMLLNIVLNIVLTRFLGLGGLALATSISAIVCSLLLFISLRLKIGSIGIKRIVITFIEIVLASLIMGAVAKLAYSYLVMTISESLSLLHSITVGALIYFTTIVIMRIEEVGLIVNVIKKGKCEND